MEETILNNTASSFLLGGANQPKSFMSGSGGGGGSWVPIMSKPFDGEKTAGELGNVVNLYPNHNALRHRSYEAELKSDIVRIITGKFFKWVVGNGLKLQSEPDKIVLKSEGIDEDVTEFKKIVEARFRVFANSKLSTYDNMTNLHRQAFDAYKTAFLGGDCLVILRIIDDCVKVQVIDGQEVQNPIYNDDYFNTAKKRGNIISSGIEKQPNGEHYGYYVRSAKSDSIPIYEFVKAKSETTGNLMAWMVYGSKHRINHDRGIPQITAILEKIDKLDRYTEASVAGAEERAKIAYFIEHNQHSDGENPLLGNIKKQFTGRGSDTDDVDAYNLGNLIEKRITATTGKQTFNMPIGSKLNAMAASQETSYDKFFNAVFVQLCASNDIPPEVALQKYSSNYSASRAAINGWGYLVDFYRKNFSFDFYKNFYNIWLEVEILKGTIKSDGLLKSILSKNKMALEGFFTCKFTGANMPHIDPLKEVKAMRELLGDIDNGIIPLTSYEAVTEQLGEGEWSENFAKFIEEQKIIKENVKSPIKTVE